MQPTARIYEEDDEDYESDGSEGSLVDFIAKDEDDDTTVEDTKINPRVDVSTENILPEGRRRRRRPTNRFVDQYANDIARLMMAGEDRIEVEAALCEEDPNVETCGANSDEEDFAPDDASSSSSDDDISDDDDVVTSTNDAD